MQRQLEQNLTHWQKQKTHLPLLLRGARQVGKTFLVETWGKAHFKSVLSINFELQPELVQCFETLQPTEILQSLSVVLNQDIVPGETLLFLDEIQECPNAIRALRYFKEKLPALHVIGAGSLLEFILKDSTFRMPVGRVQFIYLKPFSFKEFLIASKQEKMKHYLENVTLGKEIPAVIHQALLKLIREYWIVGGMPAVISHYLEHKSYIEVQQQQATLLNTYRHDFGKYATRTQHTYLQQFFMKVPGLIARDFKYSHVDNEIRARELKVALEKLHDAGLIKPVYATSASGLPLASMQNEKKIKLFFLDIGLVMRSLRVEPLFFEEEGLLVNQGALAEQFVAQELQAYHDSLEEAPLFFWAREKKGSQAAVDFVISVAGQIIPLEVKSGTTGRLKSVALFMQEKKAKVGVRISQLPLSYEPEAKILSVPFYLIAELPCLLKTHLL